MGFGRIGAPHLASTLPTAGCKATERASTFEESSVLAERIVSLVLREREDIPASHIRPSLPTGGSAGQILYIYVSDPDGATVGGTAQASGTALTYIYVVGGWRLF
ncbi:MAG: hypothetical protein AB7H80_17615 [Candidatus Kapaibacterium sp.]